MSDHMLSMFALRYRAAAFIGRPSEGLEETLHSLRKRLVDGKSWVPAYLAQATSRTSLAVHQTYG